MKNFDSVREKILKENERFPVFLVEHEADSLSLDIDSAKQLVVAIDRMRYLKEMDLLKSFAIFNSKTSGHFHVKVFIHADLPVSDRIALQSALGSDPVLELKRYHDYLNGSPNPILTSELMRSAITLSSNQSTTN